MKTITMTTKELKKLDIIKRLIRKEIKAPEASCLLKLTKRQIRRIKKRVIKQGDIGVIHLNRGKISNRRLPDKERQQIAKLLHESYHDFGPTFAAEKLEENHQIVHDPNTIKNIMVAENLWKINHHRKKEIHRAWRERRSAFGEMQQFDGSYEKWFEDRAPKCCLLAAIDDATSQLTWAEFNTDEGVFPVFNFWSNYLLNNGKPLSIYLDKFSTYKMNQTTAINNHDTKTQFEKALENLQIQPITAHSPQAKGRIENLFGTLQDRLIKELRLAKISDMATANKFLKNVFIQKYNQQFSVCPKSKKNLHRPLTKNELKNLNQTFSKKTERVVQNDFTISFKNQWFQLLKNQPVTVCKKENVLIEEHLDGAIKIRLNDKYLNFQSLPAYAKKRNSKRQTPWVLPATSIQNASSKHSLYLNNLKTKVGHF